MTFAVYPIWHSALLGAYAGFLFHCYSRPYFALNDRWFVGARQAQKIVKRVANRAQITREVTPHVLRHTWARALQKGISLAAVQKILGHDRLTTTAIYLNLTDGHVLEEFEAKW